MPLIKKHVPPGSVPGPMHKRHMTLGESHLKNSGGNVDQRAGEYGPDFPLERAGVANKGYRQSTEFGPATRLNELPPGPDIENQTAKINRMKMREYSGGLSYEGDGWGEEK